jgi:putative peptidoglycan lipid II flippase
LTLRPTARAAAGIAGSAALVAALTLVARVVGFGRVFVFSASVGAGCTGTAYAAANQIPNVLFEVVAGGALAGAVVPVVSGALARGGREDADRVASALITWTVLGLVPVALLLAVLAGPVTGLFLQGSDCAGGAALAARMLVVFAPQVVFYGVGIVLGGVLQAHHRFAGPALAPLLSSVVVIGSYAWYAALAGPRHGEPGFLPGPAAELVLSVGTMLGVVALSLPLVVPAWRAGVRLRAELRFPAGTLPLVRSLAAAGVVALLAQQAAVVVVLALATRTGGQGALNVYQYAQAVYLLPYAVLAVPVATAAFPRLSRQAADGDDAGFAATNATTTRTVVIASVVGAAALAAAAPGVQGVFAHLDAVGGSVFDALGPAITLFALGLPGWALVAHLSRSLYALGRGRSAAAVTASGWLVVVGASLVAVAALVPMIGPQHAAVVGLATGNSVGMITAGVLLVLAVRRAAGPDAVKGVGRTTLRIGLVGSVAAVVGRLLDDALLGAGRVGVGRAVGGGLVAGVVVVVMAAAALVVVEREVLAPLLRRLRDRTADAHDRTGLRDRPGLHDHEKGEGVVGGGAGRRVLLVLATSGGGTGRHVAELAGGLAAGGSEVTVAAPAGTLAALGVPSLVPTAEVVIADRPRPPADLRALRRLRALAREADVVHAHGVRAGALAVVAARTLRRRPAVVVTVHNAAVGGRGVRAVHAVLTVIVARGADTVLGVSGDLVAELRARGARDAWRALVPAPPQPPPGRTPEQVRAELGVPEGAALLVTVARLAPQKGLEVLLDALAALRGRPLVAVVAGGGPLEGKLRRRAEAERLPLRLLGARGDVSDLLAAADVVVVPSLWEGQSLLLQEALGAGAVLVATDAGGNREVTGDAALLVPTRDPVALAGAIATLLGDPAETRRLRAAALQRAARLPSASDALDQVTTLYERVLDRRS